MKQEKTKMISAKEVPLWWISYSLTRHRKTCRIQYWNPCGLQNRLTNLKETNKSKFYRRWCTQSNYCGIWDNYEPFTVKCLLQMNMQKVDLWVPLDCALVFWHRVPFWVNWTTLYVSWGSNGYSGSRKISWRRVMLTPFIRGGGSSFLKGTGEGFFHETAEKTTWMCCHSANDNKNWGRIYSMRAVWSKIECS
jgi:hypothetical protein